MQSPNSDFLESDLVHTFVVISETGSFTAAAKRVFRTPSAISMQMKRLESQLGRPLFVRHHRRVTLTPDGDAFLVHSRDILRVNQEALSRFRIPQLEGRVRFGVLDDFGTCVVPQILSRFASTNPLVDVEVVLSTTVNLKSRMNQGEIDLILIVPTETGTTPGRLIYSEPLVWIGMKDGRALQRTPVPIALSAPGCPWRDSALQFLDEAGLPYRIAYTSETGVGQLAAVRADLAIAPMPNSLVSNCYQKLTTKDGYGKIGEYQLRLIQVPDAGAAIRAFSEHVHNSFAQQLSSNWLCS